MFIDCIDYKTTTDNFVCNQPKLKLKHRIENQNIFVVMFLSSYKRKMGILLLILHCNGMDFFKNHLLWKWKGWIKNMKQS